MAAASIRYVKVDYPITIKSGAKKPVVVDVSDLPSGVVHIFREIDHSSDPVLKISPGFWTSGFNPNSELMVKNLGLQDITFKKGEKIAVMIGVAIEKSSSQDIV